MLRVFPPVRAQAECFECFHQYGLNHHHQGRSSCVGGGVVSGALVSLAIFSLTSATSCSPIATVLVSLAMLSLSFMPCSPITAALEFPGSSLVSLPFDECKGCSADMFSSSS